MPNNNNNYKPKPFVKWAGGKRQLLPDLLNNLPNNFDRYFEPFVGAGALFFELSFENSIIVDLNSDLINTYEVIRDNVNELIKILKVHKKNHGERYYYKMRGLKTRKTKSLDIPDEELINIENLNITEKAARFIYLNRTCYNGLYRINRNGEFNVPLGSYKNPTICNEENLRKISQVLKNTDIINGDFEVIKEKYKIKKGDFVYFDPPYVPLSETSDFTSYTAEGFNKKEQLRLVKLFKYIDKKGGYCMLSNSETNFVREHYKNFNITEVKASRAINCKGKKRGQITELIITN